MKFQIFIVVQLILILSFGNASAQGIAINENGAAAHSSAMLDIQSTSKGVLIPKMTSVQRSNIASPAVGLLVFDTNSESFWFNGTNGWVELSDATSNPWQPIGNNIFFNTGNVGIGDANPSATLTVGNGDKFQVEGTRGNVTFSDDSASIKFPAVSGLNRPMIYLFASGSLNTDRMILGHSPSFPTWGMEYDDTSDVFHFRSSSSRKFTFELATGDLGIGIEDPGYPIDLLGRMRLQSGTSSSTRPGIWFSSYDNEFDRALFGMSEPDSVIGIWSQHLNQWAIEFEIMREPRIGINIPAGSPPRAEVHLYHSNFGGSNDGVRIQNEGTSGHYWNLYTSNSTGHLEFYDNGIIRARIANATGVYTAVSDERMKNNIREMEPVLPKVLSMGLKRYTFKDDPSGISYYGVIAQELQQVFPENVSVSWDPGQPGVLMVDYASLSVVALKAIQEQQAELESLKAQIESLKALVGGQEPQASTLE